MPSIIIKKIIKTGLTSLSLIVSLSVISACSNTSKKADIKSAANYNAKLGATYLEAGRLQLANEKLEKALKQNPNSSDVNHYYAILQKRIGNNKAATKHFKKAISINKKNPQLINNYGTHLCQTGHYTEAVEQFDLAIKNPFYATPEYAYTNAGICLIKANDNSQAEVYFRKALDKNSNFGSALFQMAKLNYHQGNFAKAQAFLLRYDEHNMPDNGSLSLCTKVNTSLGDMDKADICTEKRLQLLAK